jgi:hypothetical protein
MRCGLNTVLDPTQRSDEARDLEAALRRKIVGQDEAVEKISKIYQMFLARIESSGTDFGNGTCTFVTITIAKCARSFCDAAI